MIIYNNNINIIIFVYFFMCFPDPYQSRFIKWIWILPNEVDPDPHHSSTSSNKSNWLLLNSFAVYIYIFMRIPCIVCNCQQSIFIAYTLHLFELSLAHVVGGWVYPFFTEKNKEKYHFCYLFFVRLCDFSS